MLARKFWWCFRFIKSRWTFYLNISCISPLQCLCFWNISSQIPNFKGSRWSHLQVVGIHEIFLSRSKKIYNFSNGVVCDVCSQDPDVVSVIRRKSNFISTNKNLIMKHWRLCMQIAADSFRDFRGIIHCKQHSKTFHIIPTTHVSNKAFDRLPRLPVHIVQSLLMFTFDWRSLKWWNGANKIVQNNGGLSKYYMVPRISGRNHNLSSWLRQKNCTKGLNCLPF